MGLHANLLEPRRRTFDIHPLYPLHRQPRTLRISLESLPLESSIRCLSIRILDMGYSKLTKKHVQSTRKRCRVEQKDFSTVTLESG
jgi:hypothetical protein